MKKRQRIKLKNTSARQQRGANPVIKNTTPPPKKARQVETTVNTFPYYVVGGILTVGMLVNLMLWCFIVLGAR